MFQIANLTRPEGDPRILETGPSAVPGADRLARCLGWFSIGLGLTELLAPRWLTRKLGLAGMDGVVRLFGLREIGAGMLTLSTEKRTGIASRIVGDGLDLAVLAAALGPNNRKRDNAALALALVAGITLLDIATSKALETKHARRGQLKSYADRSGFPKAKAEPEGSDKRDAAGQKKTENPASTTASSPVTAIGAGAEPSPERGMAGGEPPTAPDIVGTKDEDKPAS